MEIELKCEILQSPLNGQTICAQNTTHMWCEINCNIGYTIFDMDDETIDSMKLYCDQESPKWIYTTVPDCTLMELPTYVEKVFSITLDSNNTICNDPNVTENVRFLFF